MSEEAPSARQRIGAKKRVGVLISGGGSNMKALAEAGTSPDYPAEIVLVISDKADAGGLERAREMGIEAVAISRKDYANKKEHEEAILAKLAQADLDIICLAGFMRLLTAEFIAQWSGKMINIHPSILPLFPGLNTHARALEAGCQVHGCSVHFVTEGMDEGPVIGQAAVPVVKGDTPDTLAARVLKVEHQIYPKMLALLARGSVAMDSQGKAVFADDYKKDADQYLIS